MARRSRGGPLMDMKADPEKDIRDARRRARLAARAARIADPPPLPPAAPAPAPAPAPAHTAVAAVTRAAAAVHAAAAAPAPVASVGTQTDPVPAPPRAGTSVGTQTTASAPLVPAPAAVAGPFGVAAGAVRASPRKPPAALTPAAGATPGRGKPTGVGPRGEPIPAAGLRPRRLLKNTLVKTPAGGPSSSSGAPSSSAAASSTATAPPATPGSTGTTDEKSWTPLMQVESTTPCIFHGDKGARLRVILQVYTNNVPPFRTYLGYYAYVQLRRPGEADYEDIGSIVAWRFARRTARDPDVDGGLWKREWLEGEVSERRYKNYDCIAECLRAIYNADGSVKERVGAEFRKSLSSEGEGDELVYIQQLFIREISKDDDTIIYAGNDFGRHTLNVFYTLLTGGVLPAWYHIGGTVTFILEPGYLNHPEMGATWRKRKRDDETEDEFLVRVADTLTGFYRRRGYEVYADVETDPEHGFRTLGRRVVPGEFPRGARDQVVGEWRAGRWHGPKNPSPGDRGPPASAIISPMSARDRKGKGKAAKVYAATPTPAPRRGRSAAPSGAAGPSGTAGPSGAGAGLSGTS